MRLLWSGARGPQQVLSQEICPDGQAHEDVGAQKAGKQAKAGAVTL